MYQNLGKSAYKADLSNTITLVNYLKHPEKKFKSIHLAGTNGKGSTAHLIASVLQEAGYKVGLYTSPHLKDFRERIKINGQLISKTYVVSFFNKHRTFFENHALSFFEMTVGLAFNYFSENQVDIAVVEVGMGGRLDSTNVITPEVSVITQIGLDHTQFLGDTLPKIAFEKAGIIKPQVPVVIGETQQLVASVFRQKAKSVQAPLVFADEQTLPKYSTDLLGAYQEKNVNTATQALYILREKGWNIPERAIQEGFAHVVKNTGLKGRWQVLQKQAPKIVCDTAHNYEGLTLVLAQIAKERFKELHFVLGFVSDKNHEKLLSLFPREANYYFCCPDIPRGLGAQDLQAMAKMHSLNGLAYSSVKEAYKMAQTHANKADFIFVGGSTFVVAEVV